MRQPIKAATTECDGCRFVFEKPWMHRVERTVGGGKGPSRTTERFNRFGDRTGRSVTEGSYRRGRTLVLWYCEECYAEYVRRRRREIVGWGAVLCAGLTIFYFMSPHAQPTASVAAQEAVPSAPEPSSDQPRLTEAPEPARMVGEGNEALPKPSDIQETGSPVALVTETTQTMAPTRVTPETAPQLKEAISKAVATGTAQRWKASGSAGYAVASAIEPQSGCRSVYYTIDTEHPAWKSPTETICPTPQ